MRRALHVVVVLGSLAAACKSPTTSEQELCAKAAAMFEKCESFDSSGSDAALVKDLMLDRWRGLCRAVLTGKTEQLMTNTLELYQSMDEPTKAGLRVQAECAAKTTTCADYARCDQ
jgi:hypothetical protein